MLPTIIPPSLKFGDTIAIVSPSSAVPTHILSQSEKRIRLLGFNPVLFPSVYMKYGHLSAPDSQRANDINNAFADKDINGIICLCGGTGSTRILPMLDFELIKHNPKVFVGYSDITGIHVAINRICHMLTYHGPMAATKFIDLDTTPYTIDCYSINSLLDNITSTTPIGMYKNYDNSMLISLNGGVVHGELIGGNLSLLVATLGSPYEIDCKGKILFIEDVDEHVYCIDRMLTSLALAGKFDDCIGFIIGTFNNCTQQYKGYDEFYDLPLGEVINNTIVPYKKPIITNFLAGHNTPQPTLPFGRQVILDADNCTVTFTL